VQLLEYESGLEGS